MRLEHDASEEAHQRLGIPSIAVIGERFPKRLVIKPPRSVTQAFRATRHHEIHQRATQVRQIVPFLSLKEYLALKGHQLGVEGEHLARSRKPFTQLAGASRAPVAQFLETRRYHFG